jgi:hypothetical protein
MSLIEIIRQTNSQTFLSPQTRKFRKLGQLVVPAWALRQARLKTGVLLTTIVALAVLSASSTVAFSTTHNQGVCGISVTSVAFGSVVVNTTSTAHHVALKNTGSAALSISSVGVSGTYASRFAQSNNCGTSLAAGASCTISLTFNPNTTGTRIATLNITTSGLNGRKSVSLNGVGVAGGTPAAGLSPGSLAFAGQPVGTTSAAGTATLDNAGTAALSISSVTITGANPGDFAQANNCGSSLSAGSTCTFNITFTPAASGSRTALLSVADNSAGSPQTVSLSGTGTAAAASLSPASLSFGNQPVNSKSVTLTATLTNGGSAALSLSSIALTGANPGDFAQSNTCGTSVAAGASCTLSVTFDPTTSGSRSASVSFTDNANGSPQSLSLSGTGTSATVSLSPSSLSFGNQAVNTASGVLTATLTNGGGAALSLSSVALTGTNPGDFAQSNTCGTSVAAGASCTVSVTFDPTASGSRSASVSFTDNASGSPQSLSLSGTGTSSASYVAASFVHAYASASNGSPESLTVSLPGNTFPGDLLLVALEYASDAAPASITDSQGNTFTPVGNQLSTPAGTLSRVYYASNIKGGTDTVSVTLSTNSSHLAVYLSEYSGIDPNNPIDAQAGASGNAGAASSGSATTTVAGDIIYGYCVADGACAAGSGFAARSALVSNLVEDTLASGAGSYTATATATSGWTMQMLALKPASTASLAAPGILSRSTAAGIVGGPFSYQIAATNTPTSYGATGLPAGLSVNTGTGLISGTPTSAGVSTVTLSATNASGTGTSTLALTIGSTTPAFLVQTIASAAGGSPSSLSVAIPANTLAGDTLLVAFDYSSGVTPSSVTDSQGNVFSPVGTQLSTPGGALSRVYYAGNIAGGADTITITLSTTSSYLEAYLSEYSGVNSTTPVDAQAGASGNAGAVSSGSATTTAAGNIIYGLCIGDWACSAGSGFAARSTLNGNLVEDELAGTAGSYAATGSASNGWTMQMVALQPIAASGPPAAPSVSLSPSALTFASQTVGTSSGAQIVTLSNSGNAALTVNIALTGSNPSDFAQSNNCGASVAAGATCSISVTFTPVASGSLAAALTFTDSAPGSPQSLPLSGTGTAATVSFSPTSLSFGNQPVNTTSGTLTSTLTNTGNAALSISSLAVAGTNPSDFAQSNNCGASVAAGASCTISVTFTPVASGSFAAAVSVADNASGSPQTVTLSGTGGAAGVTLSPSSLSFANQPISVTSTTQVVTLTNGGTTALNISSLTMTGTNAADFAEVADTCGTSVAAGANCTIGVAFTPSTSKSESAFLAIADNGTGSPQTVSLSGSGIHNVDLLWTDSSTPGVVGYNVYRGTTSGGESSTPLNSAPVNGTTFTDESVTAGSTYYYVVTAVGSNDTQSPASGETSTTVPST